MAVISEDAIAKGIRRVVAFTGSEAVKAGAKADAFQALVDALLTKIKDNAKRYDLIFIIYVLTY